MIMEDEFYCSRKDSCFPTHGPKASHLMEVSPFEKEKLQQLWENSRNYKGSKKDRVSVRVNPPITDLVEAASESLNINASDFLREAIETLILQILGKDDMEIISEKTPKFFKKVSDGAVDLENQVNKIAEAIDVEEVSEEEVLDYIQSHIIRSSIGISVLKKLRGLWINEPGFKPGYFYLVLDL